MWRHTLVILSNVECARIGWSDVQTPHPPPPPPKLQLDFFDLKSSWSLGGGGGGGGVWCQTPPPTTTPKLQLNFFWLKVKLKFRGWWWVRSDARHPHPTTTSNFDEKIWSFASNDIMCHISASNRIWAFKFFVGVGGGWGVTPIHVHLCACACMTDVWLQTGRRQRNFKPLSILYKLRLKSSNMASNTQNVGWSMYI